MDFFAKICDVDELERLALPAFTSGNHGELFMEHKEGEVLRVENGKVQTPQFSLSRGFGLRVFNGETTRYSHSSMLTGDAIKKALEVVGYGSGCCDVVAVAKPSLLYSDAYFLDDISLHEKINFLKSVDAQLHELSPNVRHSVVSLAASWQVVSIMRDDGRKVCDVRPLVRLSVSVIVEKNGLMESGACSGGGRYSYNSLLSKGEYFAKEALRQAEVKLSAVPSPAGDMPVVLGNGWTGVLLHEAVGHGLEGDAIRKKSSAFYDSLGEYIAAKNVTVVDDGTIQNRRGSLNYDDEGTDTQRNVLIENGKLVGFLQDRLNANLMNTRSTGNGRRESYEHLPLPRMTNTFMLGGDAEFEEMIQRVSRGVFAKNFGGGQVDTTSGKFVFSASEAYLIENGKITAPLKGMTLIGDGPSVLKNISLVGNDFALDPGVGMCGKNGQWVPVGVGEPSVLIDRITVGGSGL